MDPLVTRLGTIRISLQEARQKVSKLEREYKQLLEVLSKDIGVTKIKNLPTQNGATWKQRVLSVLEKNPDRKFVIEEVMDALNETKEHSAVIRSTLYFLVSKGEIIKEGVGVFKAKKPNVV